MGEKIKVFIKRPDSDWYATNISNTLENFQRTVGGFIETVQLFQDSTIVCNEEGRLLDLPFNTEIFGINFFGTIFLVGVDKDEFCDVPCSLKDWKVILEYNEQR